MENSSQFPASKLAASVSGYIKGFASYIPWIEANKSYTPIRLHLKEETKKQELIDKLNRLNKLLNGNCRITIHPTY